MLKDYGSYFMYVPEDYEGPLNVSLYYPGSGGAHTTNSYDADPWRRYVEGNPDQIVIIKKSSSKDEAEAIFADLTDSGLEIDKVNIYGHSSGDIAALTAAAKSKECGYDVNFLSIMDGNERLIPFSNMSPSTAQTLAENDTTVVLFNRGDEALDNNRTKVLTDAGVPVMYITCKTSVPSSGDWAERHVLINEEPIVNGYPDFLIGKQDTLPIQQSSTQTNYTITGYECRWFDYDKNQYVNISLQEAEAILQQQGRSLSNYTNDALIQQMTNNTVVNVSPDDVIFDLNAAISDLPSRDGFTIYKDELEAFENSAAMKALDQDIADNTSLSMLIAAFVNNSVLKGDMWNLAYQKLGMYDERLKDRAEAAQELGEAIKTAISKLKACMTEYDKLDTNDLDELKEVSDRLDDELEQLNASFIEAKTKEDEEWNRQVQEKIDSCTELKKEADKEIAAIEKLQTTYEEVRPILEEALAKVNSFSSMVAGITPSEVYTYTPMS